MVERQLRAMGLTLKAPPPIPVEEDVRCPAGPPPPCREGWEAYLVAVKRCCDGPWPEEAGRAIALARYRKDSGTHTMTQAVTKDGWIFLYSIPRSQA